MRNDILTDYYHPLLERNNFLPTPCPEKFSPAGQCWEVAPPIGGGYYWVYAKQDLFDIKIHDFYFNDDCCLDMSIPECISIQRYDSISGEELNPYRRLSAGDIQTIVGGKQCYRALIHKRIPIHSVGVEILPAYYEDFLKKQHPDLYFDIPTAFQSVDQATDFPAMSKLLFEIENYRGEGAAAALFTRPRSRRQSRWSWTHGSGRAKSRSGLSQGRTQRACKMWSATSPIAMPLIFRSGALRISPA